MGLESVILLLDVEKHFGIDIDDDEASRIFTVGDLAAVVAAKLGDASTANSVFAELARVIAESSGVEREKIRPSARIVRDLGID
jgi:acyl carrier protein